nr:hypothetical protein [Streptomyces aureus]
MEDTLISFTRGSSCVGILHGQRRRLCKGFSDGYTTAAENVGVRQATGVRHGVNLIRERSADVINGIANEHDRPGSSGLAQR